MPRTEYGAPRPPSSVGARKRGTGPTRPWYSRLEDTMPRTSRTLTTSALGLATALAAGACQSSQSPQPPPAAFVATAAPQPPRTVSVTGSGEIKTAPDEFVVSVGVDSFEKEAAAAKQANDRTMHALIQATQGAGVDPKDVRTEGFSLGPRIEGPYETRHVVGYEAKKTLVVVMHDGAKMEALLAELFKLGANRLDGITFGSSKIADQRKEARLLAITAAREKAAAMAGALGQKLGRPLKIEEDPAEVGRVPALRQRVRERIRQQRVALHGGRGARDREGPPPGQRRRHLRAR